MSDRTIRAEFQPPVNGTFETEYLRDDTSAIIEALHRHDVEVRIRHTEDTPWWYVVVNFLPYVLLFFFFVVILNRTRQQQDRVAVKLVIEREQQSPRE